MVVDNADDIDSRDVAHDGDDGSCVGLVMGMLGHFQYLELSKTGRIITGYMRCTIKDYKRE